jgi:hypothetical protein
VAQEMSKIILGCAIGQVTFELRSMHNENIPTRLIYLIGSNHTYQFDSRSFCDVSENALSEYRDFLQESIKRYKVVGIAEEMNAEALKKHFVEGNSGLWSVCVEFGHSGEGLINGRVKPHG